MTATCFSKIYTQTPFSWIKSLAPGQAPVEHRRAPSHLPLPSNIICSRYLDFALIFLLFQSKRTSRGTAVDLHYWIGKDSTQDEQGAAAMYVTQLDTALRGNPVQHREVQGHESETFQSYFRNGIMWVAWKALQHHHGPWGFLCFPLSQRHQRFKNGALG